MPRLSLRLVGVPRVTIEGRAVTLGSRKAFAVLALLALEGPLARARISALLWPDQPEADARRNLRREVFRLRHAGVPVDDGEAQSLAIDPAERACAVDDRSHDGPGESGLGILLDGFDRLAGDEWSDWLSTWRARLAQRDRSALAASAASHEERGDWRAALAEHLAALDADPTDETAAQHALRLHGRLGERDAALALFARLESQLRQQLGLTPLPATRELLKTFASAPAATIPASPSARSAAPVASATTPAASTRAVGSAAVNAAALLPERAPFSGREDELRAIAAAWLAGRTVYLSGPPGVGKSRLAREAAASCGAALLVHCRPDDAQLGYSSAVRALRALFDAAPDLELQPWLLRELTRLMPELGPPAGAEEAAEAESLGDEARLRLFEAYAQAWLQLTRENFDVVVLDDWQFADPSSLQLWSFVEAQAQVSATAARAGFRRLVAYRSGELARESLGLVRRSVDAGGAILVTLGGLPAQAVQTLVQRLSGQGGADLFAQRLHDATAGNPLFVLETIRHLFDRQLLSIDPQGGWQTPFDAVTRDYAELPMPPSARDALLARVHALGEDAARLLQAASLSGDRFDLALIAATSALDDEGSLAVLERAAARQILASAGDGTYRFAHDLFRSFVAESVAPARRALVHGRLAKNLVAAGADAARIARHFEQARLPREAAPWFVRAGIDAARVFDLQRALDDYGHALELGLPPTEAYAVRDRRLLLLHRLHRHAEQLQELDALAALAKTIGDEAAPYELATKRCITLFNGGKLGEALAHARWVAAGAPTATLATRAHYLCGTVLLFLGDDEEAIAELEAALAQAPTALPDREPMICAFLCHLAVSNGRLDEADVYYERSLRTAGLLQLPLARADALNAGYRIAEARHDRDVAIARLEEANALGVAIGDVTMRINYLFNLIAVLLAAGDVEAARARHAEVRALLDGKTDARSAFVERVPTARFALHAGDPALAWREYEAAFEAVTAIGETSMQRKLLSARAQLAEDAGSASRLDAAVTALAGTGAHPPGRVMLLEEALRARLDLMRGEATAAVARLRAALSRPRAADNDGAETADLAEVTLAQARVDAGDAGAPDAVGALLLSVRFSARHEALAVEAALRCARLDPTHADRARSMAARLLDGTGLTPLERARLWRACAAHRRAGADDAGAAAALAEALRISAALVSTLPAGE